MGESFSTKQFSSERTQLKSISSAPFPWKQDTDVGFTFHKICNIVFQEEEKESNQIENLPTRYSLILFQKKKNETKFLLTESLFKTYSKNLKWENKFILPKILHNSIGFNSDSSIHFPKFESLLSLGRTLFQVPENPVSKKSHPILNHHLHQHHYQKLLSVPNIFQFLHSSFQFAFPSPSPSPSLPNSPSQSQQLRFNNASTATLPKKSIKDIKSSPFSSFDAKTENEDDSNSPSSPQPQPQFIGQVLAVCDSHSNLLAVPDCDHPMPPLWKLLFNRNSKTVRDWFDRMEGKTGIPKFKFAFNKEDGVELVKKLRCLPNDELMKSMLASCSLKDAYVLAKENPHLFDFMADPKQVHAAKALLLRERKHAMRVEEDFHGVPVFFSNSITIPMVTSKGIRWLRPYFFEKEELDTVLDSSVDRMFDVLRQVRRIKRFGKSNVQDEQSKMDGWMQEEKDREEEEDEFVDPPDMKQFLSEMGNSPLSHESIFMEAVGHLCMEGVDSVLLGTRRGRKLIGMQPKRNIRVENFLKTSGIHPEEESSSSSSEGSSKNEEKKENVNLKENNLSNNAFTNLKNKISFLLSNRISNFLYSDILNSSKNGKEAKEEGNADEPMDDFSIGKESEEEREKSNVLMMPMMIGMIVAEGSLSKTSMQEAMDVAMKDFHLQMKGGGMQREYAPLFIAGSNASESETNVD